MLPPIKRAKINADQLFKGRGTSSNPSLYDSKHRGYKSKDPLSVCQAKAIKKEVVVLQTIKDNPGLSGREIARKTGFSKDKVHLILADYHKDGIISFEKKGNTHYWYLGELNG